MAYKGPIISFANVRLTRGSRTLFSGLNVDLNEGRIGLIGDNGAGKSSFLRLINGLLLPDAGSVTVAGLDTRTARAALPTIAGFVFQNPDHQIVFPTVAEEIGFLLREGGASRQAARDAALALLASHGCADWADRPVHQLSDGQKQLVCILSVIIGSPQIILLDEPFASLDLPTRHDLLARLNGQRQTVIMASHDLTLLADFDRILWLEDGELRGDGAPRDVIRDYLASHQSAVRRSVGAES